jgi:hypothetical protein
MGLVLQSLTTTPKKFIVLVRKIKTAFKILKIVKDASSLQIQVQKITIHLVIKIVSPQKMQDRA